jgi:hypothetical protein
MKALRYILSLITILSVVSVAAATFGKPYQPQGHGVQYASSYTQMPTLPMSSTGSAMMRSGSTLPMAAVSGVYTTENHSRGPRRIGGSGSGTGGNEAEETTDPFEDPLGDAILPLLMMALAFCGVVYLRRKKRTLNG